MRLQELEGIIKGARIVGGSADVLVSGVALDSRKVTPGSLFVAVPGAEHDGHDFLAAAVEKGAPAVAVQADRADCFAALPVPRLVVPDCRAALAPLACRVYDNPTYSLYLAGVTGTNGKTTTVRLIDSIARAAGDTTGVIGTLGATIAGGDLPGERTTPESPDLQRLFRDMLTEGVHSAAMECASHALAQGRTDGCAFDVGVFTNLTQDHLDYHGTMDAYRDAKARLFIDYPAVAQAAGKTFTAVLNADDATVRYYAGVTPRALLYSTHKDSGAEIIAENVSLGVDRITFTARTPVGPVSVTLGFGGAFNIANALAAIGYGVARGLSAETIAGGLAQCPPVPGRFQPVRAGQPFAALVDYAHTPDGLENVLQSARPLTEGKLIVVFGCGGDRDRGKRPKMGGIALRLADLAVVTSDNPRREQPEAIISEILAGMSGAARIGPGAEVHSDPDRRRAIAYAITRAKPGDTVVIAGKGHEDYQIIGDTKHHFDDLEVVTEEIARCAR